MTLQSCTVVIDKGKEPTEEFIKAFVLKYPTALTAVIVRDIKAEKPCEILPPIKDYSAKDILDLIKEEDVIGERKVLWACNSSEIIAEEDMQPFDILVDGEGVKHLVAFAEGDFTGFVKSESSHSPEMHAMQEYLVPYVEGLCAGLDDDVDDVVKELKKPESMKKLEGELFSAQRGTVVLVGPNIVEILQNKNAQALNAPWGWSADSCEPPKAVEKTSKFVRPGKAVTPATSTTVVKDEEGVWVKAPAVIQGNTATKLWYKGVFGKDIDTNNTDYFNNVMLKYPVLLPNDRFEEIRSKQIMKQVVVCEKPGTRDRTSAHVEEQKAKAASAASSGSAIPIPLMSNDTKSKQADLFLKPGLGKTLLDNASTQAPTIEQIKEIHAKHKTWHEQLSDKVKLDVDWSLTWPYEMYLDIARSDHQGIAVLAFNHACRALLAEDELKRLKAQTEQKKPSEVRTETLAAPKVSKFARKAS
jgi:hypothetical protein